MMIPHIVLVHSDITFQMNVSISLTLIENDENRFAKLGFKIRVSNTKGILETAQSRRLVQRGTRKHTEA